MPRWPGVDLPRPLGNQQFQELHDALMEHQVLFFRDQQLDLESQKALGLRFGELHIHPAANAPEGHPEVLPSTPTNGRPTSPASGGTRTSPATRSRRWAASFTSTRCPPTGGDTLFASMYAAYEALSARMKAYLDGLTATHDGEGYYRGRYRDRGVDDTGKVYPRASIP